MPPSIKYWWFFYTSQHGNDSMNSITIKRARELLGTESYRLSDAQIKAKNWYNYGTSKSLFRHY